MALAKIVADFRTSLATKLAAGGSTCSLQSITDDDGVTIPNGTYFFTLDGDNSQKEHIIATLTGVNLTDISSISRQGVQTANAVREHRIGSTVTITNFAHIKYLNDLLDGTTDLDADIPLAYDADPDLTGNNKKLATVKLVEDTAMAGGADASTTVKGISKLSVAPASATDPIAVGVNDPKLPPVDTSSLSADKLAALAGTSGTPSAANKYVTNDDTATAATANKVARRLAGGNITVVTESAGNNSTNAASTAYVDAALGVKKLAISTTDVTISNTTTETTLFTVSVPGGTLLTNNGIRIKMFVSGISLDSSRTMTIRLKFGSTTITSIAPSATGGVTNKPGYFDFFILANGSTSSQKGIINGIVYTLDSNIYNGALPVNNFLATGTASEDSTSAKTLTITGQGSIASLNVAITVSHVVAEIIK